MKRWMIAALVMFVFAGCKKSSSVQPATLTGTWYLNSSVTTYYTGSTLTGTDNSEYIADTYYATFNANGTGLEYNSVANIPAIAPFNFTYTKNGSTITLNFPQQTVQGTTYSAIQVIGTIQTLAGNKLTLQFTPILLAELGASEKETQYFGK